MRNFHPVGPRSTRRISPTSTLKVLLEGLSTSQQSKGLTLCEFEGEKQPPFLEQDTANGANSIISINSYCSA